MKTLALLSLLTAQAALAGDPPSTHGMLVFGRDRVLLSHLPMFHRPHDYQGIFEAAFDDRATAAYLADRARNPREYYTIVPERFVLPDMAERPRPFTASLVRGHFERGGEEIVASVAVRITRVLHFRKFTPGASQPATFLALLVQRGGAAFLAHFITAAPDFDQIVEVEPRDAAALARSGSEEAVLVEIPGRENSRVLGAGDPVVARRIPMRGESEARATLTITREIYLEHGDLEH